MDPYQIVVICPEPRTQGCLLRGGGPGFENEEHPGNTVEHQIQPVDGADQCAAEEHTQLLHDMRWCEGCQAEGEAGKDEQ